MIVLAKDSRGGRRYLTQKDVLIEVAPVSHRNDKPQRDGKGNILVWLVNARGELDKSYLRQIPGSYELKDPNPPPPEPAPEPGKKGRHPHDDKTWRGWAYDHPEVCQAIISEAVSQGCYLVSAANYITVGLAGRKIFVVFRSGVLGFDEVPKYLTPYRTKKVSGRFTPYRLELRRVVADGMRPDLVKALRQYLSDSKSASSGSSAKLVAPPG